MVPTISAGQAMGQSFEKVSEADLTGREISIFPIRFEIRDFPRRHSNGQKDH